MKKLKNVVRVNVNNEMNKFDNFIFDNLDSVLGGDWSDYDDGEEVVYEIDLMEDCDGVSYIDDWNESNIKGIVIGVDEIITFDPTKSEQTFHCVVKKIPDDAF
jgi:hypothetical protein